MLQAGSPVAQRRPEVESEFSTVYPPSSRYHTPQRVLPERPRPRHQYSVSSMDSDDSASRLITLPTTLSPATKTAYSLRDSFSPSGSAVSVGSRGVYVDENQSLRTRPALPPRLSSTRSLLGGLISSRHPNSTKRYSWRTAPDDYTIVEERNENRHNATQHRFSHNDGEMDGDISYDISSLEGPICLRPLSTSRDTVSDMQAQGTLAAEFHQLEAGGNLTGGLGGGMVLGAKLQVNASSSAIANSSSQLVAASAGSIVRGNTVRDVGLREARERGGIVAIRGRCLYRRR